MAANLMGVDNMVCYTLSIVLSSFEKIILENHDTFCRLKNLYMDKVGSILESYVFLFSLSNCLCVDIW
jgi:hypothetical protein